MDKATITMKMSLLVFSLIISFAQAKENKLPEYLTAHDIRFKRCSRAELKAFSIFHVGYAGLYQEVCQRVINVFDKSSKNLRFVYERSIPARAFREAAEQYLKTNLGSKFNNWKQAIDTFNLAYQDIEDGDYYDLIYTSQSGLKLYLNDTFLAALNDPRLGLAYLNIWFGEEPFSESLKEALMTVENF